MAATTKTKVDDEVEAHPLAHLIPEEGEAASYISRKVGGTPSSDGTAKGGIADFKILDYARDRSIKEQSLYTIRFTGPTGAGKSFVVRAWAAKRRRPLVTVSGSDGFDTTTVFGSYIPDPDDPSRAIWQNSDVLEVIIHGGLLYLDEINFLLGDQTAVFHSLLDARRSVTVEQLGNRLFKAHPDLIVVSTYNENYEGTKRLNQAFANRFNFTAEWGYDPVIETALTGSPKLVEIAQEIRALGKTGAIVSPVPTNALIDFCELAYDSGDILFAAESFLQRFDASERAVIRERLAVEDILRIVLSEINAHVAARKASA